MIDFDEKLTAYELDRAIWLSSPAFSRLWKRGLMEQVYSQCVAYGIGLAEKYPIDLQYLEDELKRLGICKVLPFSDIEQAAPSLRAYYDLQTKNIYWNDSFPRKLLELDSQGLLQSFNENRIVQTMLLHECFHHLEETKEKPVTDLLHQQYKRSFSPVFRDISAFSFVNTYLGFPPSQLLDLFWLKNN